MKIKFSPLFYFLIISLFFVFSLVIIILKYQFNSAKTPTSSLPSLDSTPTSVPWLTYRNEKYKFEFSYPSDWQLITDDLNTDVINLSKPEIADITIDPTNLQNLTSPLKKWFEQQNKKIESDTNRHPATTSYQFLENDNLLNFSPEELVVTSNGFFGQDGKKYSFIKNKKIYTIDTFHYYDDESQNTVEYQNIDQEIEKIISTFGFLPDTSTWKTYKSTQYGFEFKYPNSWKVLRNTDAELIIGSGQINIDNNLIPPTGQAIIYVGLIQSALENYSSKKIINNNLVVEWGRLISKSGSVGVVSYYNNNDPKTTDLEQSINQILSTFKFLPDTSTWKTYKNSQYGFEFKYPSQYKLIERKSDFLNFENMWGLYLQNPEVKVPHPVVDGEQIDSNVFNFTLISNFPHDPNESPVKKTTVKIGNNQFNYYLNPEGMYKTYNYEIGKYFLYTQDENAHLYDPIFSKILSTFKFTK